MSCDWGNKMIYQILMSNPWEGNGNTLMKVTQWPGLSVSTGSQSSQKTVTTRVRLSRIRPGLICSVEQKVRIIPPLRCLTNRYGSKMKENHEKFKFPDDLRVAQRRNRYPKSLQWVENLMSPNQKISLIKVGQRVDLTVWISFLFDLSKL